MLIGDYIPQWACQLMNIKIKVMANYEEKLVLDNKSQVELLSRLWNIEEMVELGEEISAIREIQLLVEDVRYSAIARKIKI